MKTPILTFKLFNTILLACLFAACNSNEGSNSVSSTSDLFSSNKIDMQALNGQVKLALDAIKADTNDSLKRIDFFKLTYGQNNQESYWLKKSGVQSYAIDYLNSIDSLRFDGLNPDDYKLDSLSEIATKIDEEKIKSISEIAQFELAMTHSFLASSHDMILGKDFEINSNKEWKIKNDTNVYKPSLLQSVIEEGDFTKTFSNFRPQHQWYYKFRNEFTKLLKLEKEGGFSSISKMMDTNQTASSAQEIVMLRKRLFKEINLPTDTISQTWDDDLVESLKKFQHQNHLKLTGIVDNSTLKILQKSASDKLKILALNMNRMRWMRRDFPQPYIWVDVPKMELDYVENDSVKFNMRVVVGRKGRPTPALNSKIENIVLSPPWTVPPTIMKEEVIPGIARRGGSYLARRGLKAYKGGRLVNPAMINAKNYKQFAISQAPGYRSSLGEVKFNMINPWAIYLHDTPHREDFVKSFRAYSSGCIRVHKPKEFAAFLLRDSLKYSYQKIDSICKKRTTVFIPFARKVDVHIVYLTNAIDSAGNVVYLKDVYGWDS